MKSWIILAALLLLAPAAVHAQGVTTSSIWGKVTDQQGTSLPGANIVATHLPSGSEYGTISDLDGNFRIPNMRVGGPYEVVISYVGFESYTQNGITLVLGQSHAIGAMLSESAVLLDEVTVIGLGGVFDADRTGIASNIDEQLIQVAPSMGRDIADFARLTPQAYVINDDDDGPAISIAGQNNRFNTIYIDGAVNNDVFGLSAQGTNGGQTGATPISIDAIEEFQINIAPFDVTQSGFTGGAINAITRSGTNVFEGSAYYYLRNQTLVGKTPTSDPTLTRERLADFSNQRYGIRLGGPIVKNKLFFFASGELLRSESPRPFNAGEYRGASASRLAEIQTVLQNELGYDAGDFGAKAASLDDNKLLGKIDWNISRDHKLSLRHSYSQSDNTDEFASTASTINFRNNGIIFPNTTNSTTMELNSLFGTRVANKLLLGYTRVKDDRGVAGRPFPSVSITDGAGSISLGPEPFSTANLLEQDIFTITNNLNLFSGRHTFTLGTHNEFY
ncbi:MAG: TonB-dependent receptor, partial [Rhodothermales bacterium]